MHQGISHLKHKKVDIFNHLCGMAFVCNQNINKSLFKKYIWYLLFETDTVHLIDSLD